MVTYINFALKLLSHSKNFLKCHLYVLNKELLQTALAKVQG